MAKKIKTQKKSLKVVTSGKIFIQATFNNTLITITDKNGDTLCWGSSGAAGFKGARKSTPYAATIAVERVLNKAKDYGLSDVDVYVKGPGPGRDAALRVLRNAGVTINLIEDLTPIPHNGCRPKKRRRV